MTIAISRYLKNRVALTMLVVGVFLLLAPPPALSVDLHKISNFQAGSAGTVTGLGDDWPLGRDRPADDTLWDVPPLFDPGSIVVDGFGGAFDSPKLAPALPPGGDGFGGSATIPEPTTLVLLALGGLAMLRRRR